jgi:hypothetical protein
VLHSTAQHRFTPALHDSDMHPQSLHGSLWHFRAASCQRDNRSRTLRWHACRLTTCHQRRAYKRIRLNADWPSAAALLLPEGASADDKVLLLWDLDNISPPGGAGGVAPWAHGLQVSSPVRPLL